MKIDTGKPLGSAICSSCAKCFKKEHDLGKHEVTCLAMQILKNRKLYNNPWVQSAKDITTPRKKQNRVTTFLIRIVVAATEKLEDVELIDVDDDFD